MPAETVLIDPGTVSILGMALAAEAEAAFAGTNDATWEAAAEGDTEERGGGEQGQ